MRPLPRWGTGNMRRSNVQSQIESIREQGYVVIRGFVPREQLARLNEAARSHLAARAAPLEFEADLQYPAAPRSHADAGGETVRRILVDNPARAFALAPRQ